MNERPSRLSLSVIVPSYRRTDSLGKCLDALAAQVRLADQVIVVHRGDDAPTAAAVVRCQRCLPALVACTVEEPGVIAAMNVGLRAATGNLVVLTDDDAVPWPDWLERIELAFQFDERLGALGGRDWQYKGAPLALDDGHETRAGHLQWWGRTIGMHHWAAPGPPREVTVVKGVNCAFRADVLRQAGGFDTRLAGKGAQVHWELALCLAAIRAGWKVVFDSTLGVDHFPAQRFDEDQRGGFDRVALQNAAHNETLALVEHLPLLRRVVFVVWSLTIGTRALPGMVHFLRLAMTGKPNAGPQFVATVRGRVSGVVRARQRL